MPTTTGQQNDILELLTNGIGLSEIEASIYVRGLSLPPLPVALFAKHCRITRQNAYNILAKLEEHGLVTNSSHTSGRHVQVTRPSELRALMHKRVEQLTSYETRLPTIIDQLQEQTFSGSVTKPRVTYYEGIDGTRRLYRETLQCREGILRTLTHNKIFDKLGKSFVTEYIHDRIAAGLFNKIIQSQPSPDVAYIYENNAAAHREFRIPPPGIVMDCLVSLFDQTVIFITLKEGDLFGTQIESTDYANTMKSWFDAIFELSSPFEYTVN